MAKIERSDISAIAITTKPGLSGSLSTGVQFSQYLSRKLNKPLIPIHHMEAHALTPRMVHKVDFPFMVLLASGGHCLLAIAEDINQFSLLGTSKDTSPGEAIDKIARRLKVHTLRPDLRDVAGGKAIEKIALEGNGNPYAIDFPHSMTNERSCNFSFSGFRSSGLTMIDKLELLHDVQPDQFIPNISDFCASVEYAVSNQLCRRIQRAFIYADLNDLWPQDSKNLVVSGGVACNKRIRSNIQKVCEAFQVTMVAPEPKYCTDNGVMIAWNGLEKWRKQIDIVPTTQIFGPKLDIEPRASFGKNITKQVQKEDIRCTWVKLKDS